MLSPFTVAPVESSIRNPLRAKYPGSRLASGRISRRRMLRGTFQAGAKTTAVILPATMGVGQSLRPTTTGLWYGSPSGERQVTVNAAVFTTIGGRSVSRGTQR